MATITMRKNKDGSRVFRIRCKVDYTEYSKTWPGKLDDPIPKGWTDTRAETAAKKQAVLFEEACRRGAITNDKQKLCDYIEYVIDIKSKSGAIKPRTIDGYIKLLSRIKAAKIANKKLVDITVKDLNLFYKQLSEDINLHTGKQLSANTIRRYHALISVSLSQAVKEQLINHNPARYAMLPKVEHKEANSLSIEKIGAIIDALNGEASRWQALTLLLIGSGMRRGEVSGLKWSDVDFNNSVIRVQRNVTRKLGTGLIVGTTKTGRERSVTVEPEVLAALKTWKTEQAAEFGALPLDCFVFACKDPQTPIDPDSISTWYRRFCKRHNLGRVNPHSFRHTQASVLLQNGDIVLASKRLGHAQTSTTLNIYGHMLPQTDKEASARVGDVLFKQLRK